MSLFKIVLRNIRQRLLSSILTAFSISLGVGVVVAILSLQHQGRNSFDQSAIGYELIVGPRGSETQLVLNTVFHLDKSAGRIPHDVYRFLRKHPGVKLAAPMAVGDAYKGFRVVGTSDLFIEKFEVMPGTNFTIVAGGRVFTYSDEALGRALAGEESKHFEAVIGALVAGRTGLKVGSKFSPVHGLDATAKDHKEEWEVVGVLKPTGTPADRAIYINLDSFFSIREHETAEREQISSVVVKTKTDAVVMMLPGELKEKWPEVMAVVPAGVIAGLLDRLAPLGPILLVVSAFVILVAGISILVSIYNSMAERRRAIAIMRALGARRSTILSIILMESAYLCLLGGIAGLILGHLMIAAAAPVLYSLAGIPLSPWVFLPAELVLLAGLVILGVLVGIIPALRAYRMEISEGLTPMA